MAAEHFRLPEQQELSSFEAHVRSVFSSQLRTPCPLDGTEQRLLQWFNCGRWALVQRDLRAVLPPEVAEHVLTVCERHAVPDAFAIRRELVNYKKAMLHAHDAAHRLEKDLRQLVAFFRKVDWSEGDRFFRHSEPHASLCDALAGCSGVLGALQDGRNCTKAVCTVGRWPGAPRSGKLERLPASLKVATQLRKAHKFLTDSGRAVVSPHLALLLDQEVPTPDSEPEREPEPEPNGRSGAEAAGENNVTTVDDDDDCPTAQRRFDALISELAETTRPEFTHMLHFVTQVLIVRGAAKALRMRHELQRYARSLAVVVSVAESILSQLQACPTIAEVQEALSNPDAALQAEREHGESDGGKEPSKVVPLERTSVAGRMYVGHPSLGEATHAMKHSCTIGGLLPVLRDCHLWAVRIAQTKYSDAVLFVAGDCDAHRSTTMFVPGGFNEAAFRALDEWRAYIAVHQLTMRKVIAEDGWPVWLEHENTGAGKATADLTSQEPPLAAAEQQPGKNKGKRSGSDPHCCVLCNAARPTLWIHRGVCFECDDLSRAAGKCPLAWQNSRCDPRLFCVHGSCGDRGVCLLCDNSWCGTCRFYRGDGEEVLRLASLLRPAVIYLDWDRTFCSTRGGGSPLKGQHTLDQELLALVHDRVSDNAGAVAQKRTVHVVTRNSYRDDIVAFLEQHGLGREDIPIHTVTKGQSKVDVIHRTAIDSIASAGAGSGTVRVLFVDDSIEELLDEGAVGNAEKGDGPQLELLRVLFVRGAI